MAVYEHKVLFPTAISSAVVSEFADDEQDDEININKDNIKKDSNDDDDDEPTPGKIVLDYNPLYPVSFAELPEYERTLVKLLTSTSCAGVYPLMREVLNQGNDDINNNGATTTTAYYDERTCRAGSTEMIVKLINWARKRKGITDSPFINNKLWSR